MTDFMTLFLYIGVPVYLIGFFFGYLAHHLISKELKK